VSRAIKAARAAGGRSAYYGYGDPGLFGFLGGLAKGVVKGVGSVAGVASKVLPGPLGTIAGGVSRAAGAITKTGPGVSPTTAAPLPPTFQLPVPGSYGQPPAPVNPSSPFGQRSLGPMLPAQNVPMITDTHSQIMCPSGYRPNKSAYYRRSPAGTIIFHPKGSTCVKIRRRNPLNPRALSRSLSRVAGAKKAIHKLIQVQVTPKGKIPIKRRRKSC